MVKIIKFLERSSERYTERSVFDGRICIVRAGASGMGGYERDVPTPI